VILQPDEDNVTSLASRLTRLDEQISETDREKFKQLSCGKDITEIANDLANIYDPDAIYERAREVYKIPDEAEPDEKQIKETIEQFNNEAIKPFDNPEFRDFIETVRKKIYQIIDETNIDRIIHSAMSVRSEEHTSELQS